MANEMMHTFFPLKIITYHRRKSPWQRPWHMRTPSLPPSLKRTDTLRMIVALQNILMKIP